MAAAVDSADIVEEVGLRGGGGSISLIEENRRGPRCGIDDGDG